MTATWGSGVAVLLYCQQQQLLNLGCFSGRIQETRVQKEVEEKNLKMVKLIWSGEANSEPGRTRVFR